MEMILVLFLQHLDGLMLFKVHQSAFFKKKKKIAFEIVIIIVFKIIFI
jgi:hypothetical protein